MSDSETIFTGTVAFWSDKGFGFIEPRFGDLGDIYVHASALPGKPGRKNLTKGAEVEFEIDVRDGKIFATNVRIVEKNETQPRGARSNAA